MSRHVLSTVLFACYVVLAGGAQAIQPGERIYSESCARCHGPDGQGVAGKYDEALYGTRSIQELATLIERTMPEDKPGTCSPADAKAVAEYIHAEFYSPEARARMQPATLQLAHLTNRQYRESVADLIASFKRRKSASTPGGLQADYFQSDGMNKKARKAFSRTDAAVDFDYQEGSPGEGISADQFSIAWQGSLLAPDTGFYDFRIKTPNGARLYLNTEMRAGDANSRDDSDERRQSALVDLWVSSGEMREANTRLFLLGGRSYPLRLDFFKFKDAKASIRLEWKPPHGEWEVLPGEFLSPETSPTVAVVTTDLPPDDGSLGYERGTAVSREWQDKVSQAAVETADLIISQLKSISGISENAPDRDSKLKDFAATLAERAFRRPLTPELRQLYIERPFANAPSLDVGLRRVLILILSSPRFLYPAATPEKDAYTIASRLALNLWDSLPDQALRDAAKRGDLLREERVRSEAKRMLNDPRAKAKLREFFHHWLMMDEDETLAKDTAAYPEFKAALVADLRRSLEHFVEQVVWSQSSDYRELLLADYVYVTPRMAEFYGVTAPEKGFEKAILDEGRRAGILSHPYLLATLSYHKSTSPIHRGVFLTRNVLGRFLKPPPMAISFMDDRFDPSLTMREKVTELTKSDTCMGCHVTINPLGFSLENFDAVGRWRTTDNEKPVDAKSEYLTVDGKAILLQGPRDLAEHAASNREARLGFIRQLFHHTVKQSPAAYHPETLNDFEVIFADSEYHVRDLFVEIALFTATCDIEYASTP